MFCCLLGIELHNVCCLLHLEHSDHALIEWFSLKICGVFDNLHTHTHTYAATARVLHRQNFWCLSKSGFLGRLVQYPFPCKTIDPSAIQIQRKSLSDHHEKESCASPWLLVLGNPCPRQALIHYTPTIFIINVHLCY